MEDSSEEVIDIECAGRTYLLAGNKIVISLRYLGIEESELAGIKLKDIIFFRYKKWKT